MAPPRSPRLRTSLCSLLLAVPPLGCAAAEPAPHVVHRHTTAVTVTDYGLLPEPVVLIPPFATVVWRNRGSAPLVLQVEGSACPGCDTVLGFSAASAGARSAAVAPGEVATLCFHDPGAFAFVARLGAIEHHGVIRVGGGR
jgi:hypothetical protein